MRFPSSTAATNWWLASPLARVPAEPEHVGRRADAGPDACLRRAASGAGVAVIDTLTLAKSMCMWIPRSRTSLTTSTWAPA